MRDAALSNRGDAVATYACLGKKPNCGQCLVKADKIIEEHREAASCNQVAV
ncbi:MAG: ferredoxin [Pseudomonadota bacterium]